MSEERHHHLLGCLLVGLSYKESSVDAIRSQKMISRSNTECDESAGHPCGLRATSGCKIEEGNSKWANETWIVYSNHFATFGKEVLKPTLTPPPEMVKQWPGPDDTYRLYPTSCRECWRITLQQDTRLSYIDQIRDNIPNGYLIPKFKYRFFWLWLNLSISWNTAQCAVCKVYFSAQPNNLKLILNFQKYYPIEHIFVPACSSARKIHFFKF